MGDRPAATAALHAAAAAAMHSAERQLLDALERVLRAGSRPGWALLVLHLSTYGADGPRPHHRRIAASLLDDTAERYTGQLFGLANGDLALLFRPPDEGAAALALIARLFGTGGPDPAGLYSLWPLPGGGAAAIAHVRARGPDQLRTPGVPRHAPPEGTAPPPTHAGIRAAVQAGSLARLLARQTAVRLLPGTARRITPLFREIGVAPPLLLPPPGPEELDVPLPGSITAQLDRPTLDAARHALAGGGPIAAGLRVPLHLNQTVAAVLSQPFASFATAAAAVPGLRIGIEVPFNDLFADPTRFTLARERIRLAGMRFLLDHVTHQALLVSRPAMLGGMLGDAPGGAGAKLAWTQAMAEAGPALAAAIGLLGPARIVLTDCDSEAAVVWGLGLGIQSFQGGFVDTMLAAERLRSCAAAARCTIGGCRDRAATLEGGLRAACTNPALLDAGLPVAA